jgi:hypothetical protein
MKAYASRSAGQQRRWEGASRDERIRSFDAARAASKRIFEMTQTEANCVVDAAELGLLVGQCGCGATVVPHALERAPILCSGCRADRVERIIAARRVAA